MGQLPNNLVLGQRVPTESSRCLNFGSISGRLREGDAKLEINRGRLEGGGGVDAHGVTAQVLVRSRRVERACNLRQTDMAINPIVIMRKKLTVLVNQLTPISYMKSEKPSLVSSW